MAAKTELKEELAKKAETIKKGNGSKEMPFTAEPKEHGIGHAGREDKSMEHAGREDKGMEHADRKDGSKTNGSMGHFIRLLRADEIECRVASVSEKGLSLLLFKDARVDQKILDETFTPFGWKCTHQSIDGNLYCTVEIWDGDKEQWIAKQDVGTESNAEKEKGQASDSFKRACFNWGVGRELYTAPFIWIPAEFTKIEKKGGRYISKDRFKVQAIDYNEHREITALTITNGRGRNVYEMKAAQETECITKMQMAALEKELKRTGVAMETVLERYGIKDTGQMTADIYVRAICSLKKTKTKKAA